MEQGKPPRKAARVTEDCFAAVLRAFMSPANPKWAKYSAATRDLWGRELRFAAREETLGAVSLGVIRPALVQAFLDGLDDRPGKAAAAHAALKQVERWAVVRDILPRQIMIGVEVVGPQGGHVPWTDDQVATAERFIRAELVRVITLGANTGQRGSDLVRMGPTDLETFQGVEGINVKQKKTGREVWVPITSPLAAAMATWERVPGPYLRRTDGKPWTRKALTAIWTYERDTNPALASHKAAGLVLHGLRGTACVRLRRAGATAEQIADMVGMSVPMVERYCRFSVQRENAVAAVVHLERTIRERRIDKSEKAGS